MKGWLMGRLLVALVALAFVGCGQETKEARLGDTQDAKTSKAPEEQRCVKLWNADTRKNNLPGGYLDVAKGVGTAEDLYVSVGFADDFPDKCLVTVVGSASRTALQVTETSEKGPAGLGHWNYPVSGSSSDVPESVKDFNATVNDRGMITLD
jgi:hypothetical protein